MINKKRTVRLVGHVASVSGKSSARVWSEHLKKRETTSKTYI